MSPKLILWCILTSQLINYCLSSPSLISVPPPVTTSSFLNPCLKLCHCGMGYYSTFAHQVYIFNCTDTKFTRTTILENLPLETEVLIFNGNNIKELPMNIFGTTYNYKKLKVIDFSNNNIEVIHGKTFHHVENVERLILNHNELSISREDYHPRIFSNFLSLKELHLTNTFSDNNTPENLAADIHDIFNESNLTLLEKLHLEQNEISIFKDSKLFCDLPNLIHLYLGDNFLKGIHFDLFCIEKIMYLDLERNKIKILMKDDLSMLDKIGERNNIFQINVKNNPFLCNCDVSYFYDWIKHTKVKFNHDDTLNCNLKKQNCTISEQDIIEKVKITDIEVEGGVDQDSKNSSSTLFISIGFLCLVVLVILVYLKRDFFKSLSAPVVDTVSRKVQYTSLSRTANIDTNLDL